MQDFFGAALPWMAMSIAIAVVAVFFSYSKKKYRNTTGGNKKGEKE